ncbi:MAG TPA: class I SAM-dependent methyltransferase [Candidatus Fournierella merdavium]|uniref:class I SAM-dependent DNA methyltransferase n=1 Tax=Candidatus Allofournierella merdavium TaxID=2838593 RepID=UPI001F949109|nr:class I SAM-dependent methyltransferase [Candidatus Fournierella merdavium]
MAYNEFAYFYDELNGEADYDALYTYIKGQLDAHGVADGILADLGCGTGDLTLMLTQAGYDMIGVDQSEEMLAVLREKADELGVSDRLLLLRQDILDLDLFGTIRGAVSTFDTYNHIGPAPRFERAIARAAFFMEEGGVFLFDLNTPYKHRQVLADNEFVLEGPDAVCRWKNTCAPQGDRVDISIEIRYLDTGEVFREQFSEYTYEAAYVERVLEANGFRLAALCDGETFGPLRPDSQRYIFTAIKQYTQLEKQHNG